jgi:transcriptional regulator with XRE-family HTH domain
MAARELPAEWAASMRDLGLLLQRRRHELGMTQEDVAYASGITRSHYQQLEKGLSRPGQPANPALATLAALARTLGVDLAELVAVIGDSAA